MDWSSQHNTVHQIHKKLLYKRFDRFRISAICHIDYIFDCAEKFHTKANNDLSMNWDIMNVIY